MSRPEQWLRTLQGLGGSVGHDSGYAETPEDASLHIADEIDLRWFGALPNPAWDHQRHPLLAKGTWTAVDNRAYQFGVNPGPSSPSLYLFLADQAGGTSTVSLPSGLFNNGTFFWIRATWRKSDGRIQFFYSEDHDNPTWTKLGADVTGGTNSIPNRGKIWVGRDEFSAFTSLWGYTGKVEIRDGIDGPLVADPDFTETGPWQLADDENTIARNDNQGNPWTLHSTSVGEVLVTNYDAERYLRMDGSGDYAETPDHADLDLTDSLFLEMLVKPDSWADEPLAEQTLVSKSASGNQSFFLDLWGFGSGQLQLGISNSGSGFSVATSSVAVPFSDGEWGWLRIEWRASDGRVQFFTKEFNPYNIFDGTWVQLGTDQVASSGSNMFVGTAPVRLGNRPGKSFKGSIIRARIGDNLTDIRSDPTFYTNSPWDKGDDSTTPAKNDFQGRPWSLEGNATIDETRRYFFHEEVGLVIGEATTEEKDLQSDATGGVTFNSPFGINVRLGGVAEGGLVLGGTFPVSIDQVGLAGLIFDTDFEIVPPEITPGIGTVWSIGIAGRGYMLSTLDQEYPFEFRSYEIQAIPQQRPQIDDADEPGEQTLFPWWSRAQHSWHEGAGQDIFDSPFSSRFRYCTSRGLDPWDEGELKFLKDTELLRTDAVDDHHLLATTDALFYTVDGVVHRDADPDTAGTDSLADHNGTPINSIASDGEFLYAAFSGGSLGIKKTPLVGALAWSDVNVQTAVEKIAVVKGRLIGAKGGNLYEYDLSVTTEPEPLNAPMPSNWKWTGITESGPAIYFSGYAGDRSEIFAVRLTAQDIPFASTTTLGAMISVWQAPEGETVHAIQGYLGQQVLVGTSRGVRIGTIVTGDGNLEVSGLITEQKETHPQALNVQSFEPQGEFAWFTWSNYDDTRSGLGRIHLGELSWSSDLMYPALGEVTAVVDYQDRKYFVLDEGANSHIVKEHATDLVATAQMELCTIRFGTREIKQLRHFDTESGGPGSYSLTISADGKPAETVIAAAVMGNSYEHVVNIDGVRFKATINFTRDSDPTAQMRFREWRLRSEPRSKGRFRYLVPLMIYDHVVNLANQEVGKVGYALENLEDLMELYRTGRDTLFQRLGTGVPNGPAPVLVTMEDLRFKTFTPPAGAKGFGGIALAILREVR